MQQGTFRAAARAMADPEAKSPEKAFVAFIKVGLLFFTSATYGEGEKKTTGLGLGLESPVVKAAIQNKRNVKSMVKDLLKMTFTEVKGIKGINMTKELLKEAFAPLAEKYFPDVWVQFKDTSEK